MGAVLHTLNLRLFPEQLGPTSLRTARTASSTSTRSWPCAPELDISGLSEHDTVLLVVPRCHADAWGLTCSGWLTGADSVLPSRFLQDEPLGPHHL